MKLLSVLIIPAFLLAFASDSPAQKAKTTTKDSKRTVTTAPAKPKTAVKPKAAKKSKTTAKPKTARTGVATPALKKVAAAQIAKLTSSQKSAMTKLLNTGTKVDFAKIPGIGQKLTSAIMKKRPFKAPEDVANVEGIGEAKLKSIIGFVKNPTAKNAKK